MAHESFTKIRSRQTIEAVIIRCGCAVKGQHPGQVCPNGWPEDQGIVSEGYTEFDILGDPVEMAEELRRERKRGIRAWLRKYKEKLDGEPSQQSR